MLEMVLLLAKKYIEIVNGKITSGDGAVFAGNPQLAVRYPVFIWNPNKPIRVGWMWAQTLTLIPKTISP